jgi:hypothetical protein
VPSLPAVVEALADGRYGLVHLCSPGPAGVAAAMTARIMELPVAAPTTPSWRLRRAAHGDARSSSGCGARSAAFYGAAGSCSHQPGVRRAARRDGHRGGAHRPLGPRRGRRALLAARREPGRFGDRLNVLYAGRLTPRRAPTCSPSLPRGRARATRACTCCWPAAARRRSACARASAPRDVPRLARGRRARPRLRVADLFLFARARTRSAR